MGAMCMVVREVGNYIGRGIDMWGYNNGALDVHGRNCLVAICE